MPSWLRKQRPSTAVPNASQLITSSAQFVLEPLRLLGENGLVANQTWQNHSKFTDPGAAGPVIDELPADLAALREASSQLVFHYRAGGDWAENGVPAGRAREIDTRYADAMFELLLSRGEPTLARNRPPPDRIVGCCRDATLLFVSLARHKGIPARMRFGFAAYLCPGLLIDHVVAEAWDHTGGRWRLIDGEMDGGWTPDVDGRPVDWLDLADDQFVTGPRAWRAARAGTSDPERHLTAPELDASELRGWPLLARHAIHDLVALNMTEMLVWDAWGMQLDGDPGTVAEQHAELLDMVCAHPADSRASPDVIATLADRDELRVPATVTSFDPYGGPPREVTLRS
jgi:Transglutaminase-like superfamily